MLWGKQAAAGQTWGSLLRLLPCLREGLPEGDPRRGPGKQALFPGRESALWGQPVPKPSSSQGLSKRCHRQVSSGLITPWGSPTQGTERWACDQARGLPIVQASCSRGAESETPCAPALAEISVQRSSSSPTLEIRAQGAGRSVLAGSPEHGGCTPSTGFPPRGGGPTPRHPQRKTGSLGPERRGRACRAVCRVTDVTWTAEFSNLKWGHEYTSHGAAMRIK